MTRIIPTEEQDCIAFVQWLDLVHPKIRFSHVPMETFTKSRRTKAKNVAMGVRSGVPDYILILPCINCQLHEKGPCPNDRSPALLFIEMKRAKPAPSKTSPAQLEWIADLSAVPGVTAVVCYGYDEAVAAVQAAIKHQRSC